MSPHTHRPSRQRSSHTAAAVVESLESRQLLSANLSMVGIRFLDGAGAEIAAPRVGERITVEVSYDASELPELATGYQIEVTIDTNQHDPFPLLTDELFEGEYGNYNTYTQTLSGWYAGHGTHSITVKLDPGQVLNESDLTDNVLTTQFTTTQHTTLPQKLLWPVGGQPQQDWSVRFYFDIDPRKGEHQDFKRGVFQYDGHAAIDIDLANFRTMDRGIPVYAVADGEVVQAGDGNFDRITANGDIEKANFLTIDHGTDWVSRYAHFMQYSVTVEVGDIVKAGDVVAYVGSSGASQEPHLHYTLQHTRMSVETMFDPATYWLNPPNYQGFLKPTILDIGVTDYDPNPDIKEYPAFQQSVSPQFTDTVYLWYRYSHFSKGDDEEVKWYRPGNVQYNTGSKYFEHHTHARGPGYNIHAFDKSMFGAHSGLWTAKVFVNGKEAASTKFYSLGPNENLRVEHDGTQIIDGRTTAIDFGEEVHLGSDVTKKFVIQNKGHQPLFFYNLSVPQAFSLVGPFPSSLNAGESATVTIRMHTSDVGRKFGRVSFLTTDTTYDTEFSFNLSGNVGGTFLATAPVLELSGPAIPYVWGQGKVLIDPDASFKKEPGGIPLYQMVFVAEIASGNDFYDWIGVQHEGNGPGQIGISGVNVLYEGQLIGKTAFGGYTGHKLLIDFTKGVTAEAVDKLVKRLMFFNTSWQNLRTHPRYLKFYLAHYKIPEVPLSDVAVRMVVVAHKHGEYPGPDFHPKAPVVPVEIDKMAAQGTRVVQAAEEGTNADLSYQIVDGNADGAFAIDPQTGEITVADPQALAAALVPSMAERAYELDQELGLFSNGKYWDNWGEAGERWIQGSGGAWYFLTPDGALYRWTGAPRGANFLTESEQIGQLDFQHYANPQLLCLAREPHVSVMELAYQLDQELGLHTDGKLYENWGGAHERWIRGTGGWYFLTPDGTLYRWTGARPGAQFLAGSEPLGVLDSSYYAEPQTLCAARDPEMLQLAYQLDQELGLYSNGHYFENWGGVQERWIRGAADVWYFLTPDGTLYRWTGARRGDRFLTDSERIGQLDASYYTDPQSLCNAPVPAEAEEPTFELVVQAIDNQDLQPAGTLLVRVFVRDASKEVTRLSEEVTRRTIDEAMMALYLTP